MPGEGISTANVTGYTTGFAGTVGLSFVGSGFCYGFCEALVTDFWICSATRFVMVTSSQLQHYEIPFSHEMVITD